MDYEHHDQIKSFEFKHSILEYVFLFFFSILFLLNSLLVSIIAFQCASGNWEVSKYFSDSSLDFLLYIFPYNAFIISIILFIVSVFLFRFSSLRYRFSFYISILIVLFGTFFGGLSFYYLGIAELADKAASNFVFYNYISSDKENIWNSPELGLLSGEIGIINDVNDFLLVDFSGRTWNIKSRDPLVLDRFIIKTGNKIKLIGRKNQELVFDANEIRPY